MAMMKSAYPTTCPYHAVLDPNMCPDCATAWMNRQDLLDRSRWLADHPTILAAYTMRPCVLDAAKDQCDWWRSLVP